MRIQFLKAIRTSRRSLVAALGASALLMAGTAHALLQDRDLNGDTVVDAFYDTDLDITWLRDANVNGWTDWNSAMAWVAGFSFAGYDDWRLPTSDTCDWYNCAGSEMGHLWYIELGNTAGAMTNTGSFLNLQSNHYWSSTEYAPNPSDAWYFSTSIGFQDWISKTALSYAMAVRAGDVPAVPEPQTYALLLGGLGALALARRRRWG